MIVKNKKYFVTPVNTSKANQMTALYHYSGTGFIKSSLNLGVFRNEDSKLVGVMQFGCSYQEKIRLDRYVKESITKDEYLELNRFSMADSEGKNSESQAISLGIKWIQKHMPKIRLLVSYAGRKEGNYGYIYQATNWDYLGYFISEGFWLVDGKECHLATLWYRYKKYGDPQYSFTEGLCHMYKDVRKTWTKQFIYIKRLDKTLTPVSDILSYPKPATEYPIKTREKIYIQNDEIFNSYIPEERKVVNFYYNPTEQLFSDATLAKRNGILPTPREIKKIAVYDVGGHLESVWPSLKDLYIEGYHNDYIRKVVNKDKMYKQKYFKYYNQEPIEQIDVPIICYIEEIPFNSLTEIGNYLGVSRQAVHQAKAKKQKTINGKEILWVEEEKI